tara:strand:+ start:84 stop:1061 length:978 start_codon:yes stop_codon:yes gene_type:complete
MTPESMQELQRLLLTRQPRGAVGSTTPDVGSITPISPFEMQRINSQQFSRDPVIANMQKLGRGIKDFLIPQTPTDIALSGIAPAKLAKGLFKTDYIYTPTFKNKQAVEKNFTDRFQSGFKNPKQMYATAQKLNPGFQKEIADISSGLGLEKAPKFITKRGKQFDVEVKSMPSIADKQLRGRDISEITDPVRTRIFVNKPENADDVVSELRKKYNVLDEGEKLLKSSGFQARNVNVAYKSPTGETIIGEVQLISKPMAEASAKAHPFYTKQRSIRQAYFKKNPDATDIPENIIKKEEDLLDIQRKFFAEARKKMDKSFLEKVATTK